MTVNVKTEGEAAKEEAAEGEVLYPTDWAVIVACLACLDGPGTGGRIIQKMTQKFHNGM